MVDGLGRVARDGASGIVLMLAAAGALLWANTAPESYAALRDARILHAINDGLMAIFFLVVGLELKREILTGELSSASRAVLPIAAAAGGMVVPGAIYAALNAGGPGARGWGIPMATDIAFALGALALLGARAPASLRIFLTAVAIADDLGAIVVISVFYTDDLAFTGLAAGALFTAALVVVNRVGVRRLGPYLLLGLGLWFAVLESGVHATVAGVLLAFAIPDASARLEHRLQPWVAFGILPVFALANAGVHLADGLLNGLLDPIALGAALGLVAGKPVGIIASCRLCVGLGVASLPSGTTWRQLYGVTLLCGVGFTMSLFIATLALDAPGALRAAKIGTLTGSAVAGLAGCLVLAGASRRGRKFNGKAT
jgi:NhaA family Na+:H+ antiporter